MLTKYSDAAWSTGLVLENLRLKVEAFEYLQLPFAIQEGTLGRLEIQVIHPLNCVSATYLQYCLYTV